MTSASVERARAVSGREPPEELERWLEGIGVGLTVKEITAGGKVSAATVSRWLRLAGVAFRSGRLKKVAVQ